jgi:hypothetical protein
MTMSLIVNDDEKGDVLESMPVGFIELRAPERQTLNPSEASEDAEGWRKWFPFWQNPQALAQEQIGNCYEMTAEYLLTILQPYPGDELNIEQHCSPHIRFGVK